MPRYTVTIVRPLFDDISIVVPLADETTIRTLSEETLSRAKRIGIDIGECAIQVRINGVSGPVLDDNDLVSDLVDEKDREKIFLCISGETVPESPPTADPPAYDEEVEAGPSHTGGASAFYIRVITPHLARKHARISDIPVHFNAIAVSGTLEDIQREALSKLQNPTFSPKYNVQTDLYIDDILIETDKLKTPLVELDLTSCLVNGALNVHVVFRHISAPKPEEESKTTVPPVQLTRPTGEDKPPVTEPLGLADLRFFGQSDRGVACFLGCLATFKTMIKSYNMEERQQESILAALYQMTRFFPILRAVRNMMDGHDSTESETAILVHCFNQLLEELLFHPERETPVRNSRNRMFEGSRLLFGAIFDVASKIIGPEDATETPLLDAYKTIDFKNAMTGAKCTDPVQSNKGMVDRETIDLNPEVDFGEVKPLAPRFLRIFMLSGGKYNEYNYFNYDNTLDAIRVTKVTSTSLDQDLSYLSVICSRNKFAPVLPAQLHGAQAPCLTLDEKGHMAIYIGRPPCAGPGEDFEIKLPTTNEEKRIDVSKVTQALEPILKERQKDGSIVFESPTTASGRERSEPDELIMFVVDCSKSMESASGFKMDEAQDENENSIFLTPSYEKILTLLDVKPEPWTQEYTLEELEMDPSFKDMVAIMRSRPMANDSVIANNLITSFVTQERRKVEHHYLELLQLKESMTDLRYERQKELVKTQVASPVAKVYNFEFHSYPLMKLLMMKVYENFSENKSSEKWLWKPGGFNPNDASEEIVEEEKPAPVLNPPPIPEHLICPITKEIFSDPVRAADGHVYERKAIRRWINDLGTSPLLPGESLKNKVLSHDHQTGKALEDWAESKDLLPVEQPKRFSKLFASSTHYEVQFRKLSGLTRRLESRRIPKDLTIRALYEVVFRRDRGKNLDFYLVANKQRLLPSETTVKDAGFKDKIIVDVIQRVSSSETRRRQGSGLASEAAPGTRNYSHQLVKLYESGNIRSDNQDKFAFAFWHKRTDPFSPAYLIMKYWRFLAETSRSNRHLYPDVELWGNLKLPGDNYFSGTRFTTWSRIDLGYTVTSMGNLKDENPFENTPAGGVPVFKFLAYPYEAEGLRLGRQRKAARSFDRLDVSKEIFGSFINRTLAYNYANHCGLLPFSTSFEVSQEITHVLENFRQMVMEMDAYGETALWSALGLAIDKVNEAGRDHPKAKKRVVCFSDGRDTTSKITASIVLDKARSTGVVIDSFCIGEEDHSELMWVCHNTGGYKFQPASLEDAMSVAEMEPVLSLHERPAIIPSRVKSSRYGIQKTPCTRHSFPERKSHPNDADTFTRIEYINTSSAANSEKPVEVETSGTSVTRSTIRTKRLLSEMRNIAKNPHEYYDVYVSDKNMGFWKIIMQGPPESAYSGGTFILYLDMDEGYPLFGPKRRFVTPILHPNINKHGRICHSIFDRNWTTDTTNLQILHTIFGLLSVPESSDPINMVVTFNYRWDEVNFREEVGAHIEKHAMKSRATLRAQIEGKKLAAPDAEEEEVAYDFHLA